MKLIKKYGINKISLAKSGQEDKRTKKASELSKSSETNNQLNLLDLLDLLDLLKWFFMTLTHRRIIYVFFILIFLISAPIIILRVSGYRFNFTRRDWQKTGMIFLETKPAEVDVYLNNQLVGQKTPLRIKDLTPNHYALRIEKDGFQKWEKEIQIIEGQTNTIQYVRLFKNNQTPRLVMAGEIIKAVMNKDRDRLAILKKLSAGELQLILVDLNSLDQIEVVKLQGLMAEKMEFVDDGARLAIYIGDDLRLISLNSSGLEISLKEQLGVESKITNIKLETNNSNNVYYLKNNQLYKYNWLLKSEELLPPHDPVDYLVWGAQLYLLNNDSLNSTVLKAIDLTQGTEPETIDFMDRGNYSLSEINENFLTVYNKDKQELLAVSLKDKSSESTKGVEYYQWGGTGTEMIFGNDYELWVYRPLKKTSRYILFTRASNPITAATWYPVESHLFYAEGGLIKVVENMEKDGLIFNLGQFDETNEIFINKKGDKMLFTGVVGQTAGLYEMTIQ